MTVLTMIGAGMVLAGVILYLVARGRQRLEMARRLLNEDPPLGKTRVGM